MSTPEAAALPSGVRSGGEKNDSFSPEYLNRYSRLSIYLKSAIDAISSGVSEEVFASYLGELKSIKKSKSVPGKIQKKMKSELTEALCTQITETIEEEHIKENLQQLEKLVDESILDEGQKSWRPNGVVEDHVRSHLMQVKQKHKDSLEKLVRVKEQDCESLKGEVVRLRTQVKSLESRLLTIKSQCEDSSVEDRIDNILEKAEDLE